MGGTDFVNPKVERRESTVLQVCCTGMYVQVRKPWQLHPVSGR